MYYYLLAIAYFFLFIINPIICFAYFARYIRSGFNYKSGFWKVWAYPFASVIVSFAYLLQLLIVPLFFYKDFDFAKFEASTPVGTNWHFIIMLLYLAWTGFFGAAWFADWEWYRDVKKRMLGKAA